MGIKDKTICIFCGQAMTQDHYQPNMFKHYFYCFDRCFEISNDVNSFLEYDIEEISTRRSLPKDTLSALLRFFLFRKSNSFPIGQIIPLTREEIKSILELPFPTPSEQVDNIIMFLGNECKIYGKTILHISNSPDLDRLMIEACIADIKTANIFIDTLINDKYLEKPEITTLTLTLQGWKKYEELIKTNIDSKKAFMAMQFDKIQIDFVNKYLKPAVKETGFDLVLLTDISSAESLIDNKLRVAINNSRFLICDLTHQNKGAYWEAGYAEGLGRPVIYICEEEKFDKDKPHFDTNHQEFFKWKDGDEASIKKFVDQLQDKIRVTIPLGK